jgi:hypothetical protein
MAGKPAIFDSGRFGDFGMFIDSSDLQPVWRDGQLFERLLSPQEVAQMLNVDECTARRLFRDEPGVIALRRSNRQDGKRDYVTLRIPESVFQRFCRERSR